MNLSKNMNQDMNGVMKGIPMSEDTGMTFFAQSKPTGEQRQLGIGKRKHLSNLYIVCPM